MSSQANEILEPFEICSLCRILSEIVDGKFKGTEYLFKEWCDNNWRKNVDVEHQDERMTAALQIAADVDCQWDLFVANEFADQVPSADVERGLKLPKEYYETWLRQTLEAKAKGPGLFEGDDESTVLYRPTGPKELDLVRATEFKSWPPRLPDQPIFYPVTNEAYATQIAREWNVKASGVGYVTRFRVKNSFMRQYRIEKVGGRGHFEWWIPAEKLEELNENIVGKIEVIGEYK